MALADSLLGHWIGLDNLDMSLISLQRYEAGNPR